ncbi:ribosomal protein S18-alanine N-acetyltransferase [Clostridium senegalense]|uniref:[Ribosomal protein bS18]-alanine N-acetyltransferase n=1 Tax=Clostridium senegalense TaxID=1465809 RepID=A0A6M0H3B1_9CLOT|nr:ribosomal protein S18-alanine N-acetyltransferase [Clostridium senegalense]NEU04718.1 ribosomal protein S18-alanine N-acetyltransferase [Clostridium senegalense]
MDNLSVENINENNIFGIEEISELSFHSPWSLESIKKELSNSYANYVVLKLQDKHIGFAGAWVIFDEAHITNIAIHPNYRGLGYSHIIMDALLEKCKNAGANSMTLEVRASNIAAQKLYEGYGFKVEGIRKNYYDNPKEDGYIMWKYDI